MTTVDEDICRFCFEKAESDNPLIDPCKCIGSTKYVHVLCLRQWRLYSTNHEWTNKCQLCLTEYMQYLRWQKEENPIVTNFLFALVDKHYAITIIIYYLHLAFLSFYQPLYTNRAPPSLSSLNPFDTTAMYVPVNIYSELEALYFTKTSQTIYNCLLAFVTGVYIKTYYSSFWKFIRNKRLYASFWLSCVTDRGIFQTPLMTLFMFILSAVLATQFMIPFAFFYVYMLASIFDIHMTIIRHMNADAEIF